MARLSKTFVIASLVFTSFLLSNEAEAGLILHRPNYTGLNAGLVGFWSFDGKNTDSSKAYDVSGQNNHGTLTNGPKITRGKLGQALEFDGVDDYVTMGDAAVHDFGTGNFTLTAWVKIPAADPLAHIIHNGADSNSEAGYRWGMDAEGDNLSVTIGNGTSRVTGVNNNFVISDNQWRHAAIVWDRSTCAHYIDGALNESDGCSLTGNISDNDQTGIGANATSPGGFLKATIDDIRVYNRALTADEIKRLYRIGATLHVNTQINNDSLSKGLVGWWTFDGKNMDSSKAYDISGQNNHGTLTNGPKIARGKLGQALEFDGVNDVIVIGSTPVTAKPLTLCAWFNTSRYGDDNPSDGTSQTLVYIGEKPGESEYDIFVGGNVNVVNNPVGFRSGDSSGSATYTVSSIDHSLNTWQHVCGSKDASDLVTVYLDGVARGSKIDTRTPTGLNSVRIGNDDTTGGTGDLLGKIDDVRIYNRALTADEIKRLYRIGATLHVNTQINNDSLSKGLVGYWSFDGKDTDSSKAYDRSGQNNHGTLTNGPKVARGKLGQALEFDGSDDYVQISSTHFSTPEDWTVSLWYKPHETPLVGTDRLFNNGESSIGTSGFRLLHVTTGKPRIQATVGTDSETNVDGINVLALDKWVHLVGIKSGTSLMLFVDGTSVPGTTLSSSVMDYTGSDPETRIGAHELGNQFTDGLIDDVRIYNRALTADEIKRLYQIGGGR